MGIQPVILNLTSSVSFFVMYASVTVLISVALNEKSNSHALPDIEDVFVRDFRQGKFPFSVNCRAGQEYRCRQRCRIRLLAHAPEGRDYRGNRGW